MGEDNEANSTNLPVELLIHPRTVTQFGPSRVTTDGQFQFQLRGDPDTWYPVETSTNLVDWDFYDQVQIPLNGVIDLFEPNLISNPCQFFRVRPTP